MHASAMFHTYGTTPVEGKCSLVDFERDVLGDDRQRRVFAFAVKLRQTG